MNKIFKVIWNTASQSWTVVSELTKAHKKQSAVKKFAALSTTMIATQALAAVSTITPSLDNNGNYVLANNNDIAIGKEANLVKIDSQFRTDYEARLDNARTTAENDSRP